VASFGSHAVLLISQPSVYDRAGLAWMKEWQREQQSSSGVLSFPPALRGRT
jgi:hypothetical protein